MVPERFTVETAMPELPLLCQAKLFGWECARERKIISALDHFPEIVTAQSDGEWRYFFFFWEKHLPLLSREKAPRYQNYQNARGCALMATTQLGGRPGSHVAVLLCVRTGSPIGFYCLSTLF